MATRNTVQKTIVANALNSLANHPTADAVYDYVHANHPSISKATVYRILSKMSDESQILRVRINNGADHFDHQTHPHYHVRCTACGRVDDVPAQPALVDSLGAIIKQAASESEYCITHAELQFDGLCPVCQAKAATSAAKASIATNTPAANLKAATPFPETLGKGGSEKGDSEKNSSRAATSKQLNAAQTERQKLHEHHR